MELRWTSKALDDLSRLYAFLHLTNPDAAAKILQAFARASEQLPRYPRLGERLDQFTSNEMRRIFAGNYEIRYEIREAVIYIARVWHTRENR